MKSLFPGYYRPTEEEFKQLWNKSLFVLDTNVLLNLYRVTETTRESLLGILSQLSSQIWLPHQVALEFQRNRSEIIVEQVNAYDKVTSVLDKIEKQINEANIQLKELEGRHYLLNVQELTGKLLKNVANVKKQVAKQKSIHPNWQENDIVLNKIDKLYTNKIGVAYSDEKINEIIKAGAKRYADKVPPGFNDTKDKDGIKPYGDLIIWMQMIDKSIEVKKPIIFITNDAKDDWWYKAKHLTIGPRPELREEMLLKAGTQFYMYDVDQFVERAQTHLQLRREEAEAVRSEIRKLRANDLAIINNEFKSVVTSNFQKFTMEDLNETIRRFSETLKSSAEYFNYVNGISRQNVDNILKDADKADDGNVDEDGLEND